MGQNKRYPGHRIEHEVQNLQTRPRPIELTPEELDLEHDPVTKAGEPIPVAAWVRFPEITFQATEAEAIAWTSRAVQIRWKINPFVDHYTTAWVWASAVTRR